MLFSFHVATLFPVRLALQHSSSVLFVELLLKGQSGHICHEDPQSSLKGRSGHNLYEDRLLKGQSGHICHEDPQSSLKGRSGHNFMKTEISYL